MSWSLLKLNVPNVPKILVKSTLDGSGYRVELTDLSRIWSEAKSKEELIQHALDSGSSIDPSEDDEQFKIFIRKIESALKCEDGTSLNITPTGGEDRADLRIDLTAPLPHPLPPFMWTLQLQRLPEQHIRSELVTPLIVQASALRRQIGQLINELHDKDRIISKICDRLETSGNDLTTVFPGASNIKTSRKKGQREQLAKHVKGLEDFDENAWRNQSKVSLGDGLNEGVIDEVFRDLPPAASHADDSGSGNWWESLSCGSQAAKETKNAHSDSIHNEAYSTQKSGPEAYQNQSESLQEDEFQRQGTPQHLKSNIDTKRERDDGMELTDADRRHDRAPAHQQGDDESTTDGEDEDDLDEPARPQARVVPEVKHTSPSAKKLGVIGGRGSHQAATPSTEHEQGEEEVETRKTRSKLGTIGGRSKDLVSAHTPAENAESPNASSPVKTSRMGAIGGKKTSKSASPTPAVAGEKPVQITNAPSPRQSRTPAKDETPPVRENSQERADRKRDQLKRELEEKAKMPVKKKRKF